MFRLGVQDGCHENDDAWTLLAPPHRLPGGVRGSAAGERPLAAAVDLTGRRGVAPRLPHGGRPHVQRADRPAVRHRAHHGQRGRQRRRAGRHGQRRQGHPCGQRPHRCRDLQRSLSRRERGLPPDLWVDEVHDRGQPPGAAVHDRPRHPARPRPTPSASSSVPSPPAASAATGDTTAAPEGEDSGGTPVWVWFIVFAALAAAIGATFYAVQARRVPALSTGGTRRFQPRCAALRDLDFATRPASC